MKLKAGRIATEIVPLLTMLSLLVGCGFSINSTAGPTTSQSPGGSGGGVGGPGGQTVALPGAVQALTGCTNPNTGTSNGDWGVTTSPVYTTVDNTAPAVGMPLYTANTIFWTSRENAPGQSILLTGAFTDATKSRIDSTRD